MTQEERDNLLLDLKKGQKERDSLLLDLKKGQKERDSLLLDLKKGQEELNKRQDETNLELRKLSQTVAKIEYEHGQKLEILFDVVTSHTEKFDSIEKRLDSIERKVDRHSDQIYYLNSKVQAF